MFQGVSARFSSRMDNFWVSTRLAIYNRGRGRTSWIPSALTNVFFQKYLPPTRNGWPHLPLPITQLVPTPTPTFTHLLLSRRQNVAKRVPRDPCRSLRRLPRKKRCRRRTRREGEGELKSPLSGTRLLGTPRDGGRSPGREGFPMFSGSFPAGFRFRVPFFG